MSANRFGQLFTITSFGESHGEAMGVVVDGCPSGVAFDMNILLNLLARRRPGGELVSARPETDEPEILSGVFDGKTLGTPIAIVIRNRAQKSSDYAGLQDRPGHADDIWRDKFEHVDPRGGGRSSGRETVARVAGAAVAKMFLAQVMPECSVVAYPSQVGPWANPEVVDKNGAFSLSAEIQSELQKAKVAGESYGATIELVIRGVRRGLGQPVFHKLKSDLASALMSIGATTAVEFGEGFSGVESPGTVFHREMKPYGGIRGGVSTGEEIRVKIGFKPTSSILDVAKKGRHDPCVGLRGAVVCEAMAWLVLADHELWRRLDRA